ncbi:ATP-binding protein [Thiothrix nivea]|uniref:Putative anti-sigma regulatory factor, serine/threonine protein kinase n=1 Tax=Thiothrix nivea (strain ATCC 35100 / DSM 5205 / JP2) TaxID=870187 RepID=A0A656HFG4_THINJ|nr:ATP-binding protein [Thiothrix nivea]EIJ33919.1 putative anti-sigma regulatory factor, serine/threonine protein kinase [Thiothrix nivea DSM 5205]
MDTTFKEYNIRLSIDSRLEQVRVLSGALRGIGQELALSDDKLGQLELMMVEAVNNVIEHAYQLQAGNDVHVRVEYNPQEVHLIISDHGHAMPDELHAEARDMPDPEDLPEGGWGMGLIHALADSIRYIRDARGNHLYVSKQLV